MPAKKKSASSSFSPGKGKTWAEKVVNSKPHEVKKNENGFADIPAGGIMLIPTAKIIDEYVRQIPKGKEVTLQIMRKDLATEYRAEYTCPVTTGIFLRIVAEAAHEELMKGKPIGKIAPFWRVVDEKSTIGKKVSFGPDFIKTQRTKEGLSKDKT
jgi:hypothetical protein